jgi:LysW-gamma-L-lysine carboxypeptidase
VTVAYKGRLLVRLALERDARHAAAPGPTVAEEALALWAILAERAAGRRAVGPFEALDCRLEGVRGGGADGLVESAELLVGYRLPPGVSSADLAAEVRALASAYEGDARVRVEQLGAEEPVRTPRTSALAQAFARAIGHAGGRVTFKAKSGTSDLNVLAPAWRCPMVAYGPGDARYDHTPLERLALDEYARSIAVLRDVVARSAQPIP